MNKLVIRGGHLVDPRNNIDEILDLLVVENKIEAVGKNLEEISDAREIDATDFIVVPGLVDMHVHLREPGFEHKENIMSGTRAAAHGGFTSVACMANTNPVVDSPQIVEHILSRMAHANVFPIGSITKNLAGKEMVDVRSLLSAGVVAFSDDGKTVMNSAIMRDMLSLSAELDFPLIDHCEDHSLTAGTVMNLGETSDRLGFPGQPNAAEDLIVARDILLAEMTGGHIHIAHVSSEGAVELIRWGKARGVKVTAEAAPHHFTLTDREVERHGTNAKMHPPLRTAKDVAAVVEGLLDGTIDVIATDHAPHADFEKGKGMATAPPGIVGLETSLPLSVTNFVRNGKMTLGKLMEKMSLNPAEILGIDRGTLSVGAIADLALIDLELCRSVDVSKFASKGRNTPFGGLELFGWSVMSICGGTITYDTIAERRSL